MDATLSRWIAQSESWHVSVDFLQSAEVMSRYNFRDRPDDFYISLLGNFATQLKGNELEVNNDLLSIAKGLEIYSLAETRQQFRGVDSVQNALFAASAYYLAGYQASAWLLAKLYPLDFYKSEADVYLSGFLQRDLSPENPYLEKLRVYLELGDSNVIDNLIESLRLKYEYSFRYRLEDYLSYKVALKVTIKFKSNNFRSILNINTVDQKQFWAPFTSQLLNRYPPIWDFFPSQKEAIERGILNKQQTISLQMPTSAGKTAICELVIYSHIKSGSVGKILFLAPFRALAAELKYGMNKRLGSLGIITKALYGGELPTLQEQQAIEDCQLLITTPEKFMAMEQIDGSITNLFSLVVCDEGHLLDSQERGLKYELLLSRLKNDTTNQKKFIFLSAIIPNIQEIHSWLDANKNPSSIVISKYKPTELEFAFLQVRNKVYNLEVNPNDPIPKKYVLNKVLSPIDFKYFNPQTNRSKTYPNSSRKAISVAITLKASNAGSVALFTTMKRGSLGVMTLGEELVSQCSILPWTQLKVSSEQHSLNDLKEYFKILFGDQFLLTRMIPHGCAFHHGDLPQDTREILEDAFRDKKIRIVVCTSTLAEGVNLPIKTLVVHTFKRYEGQLGYRFIKKRDAKNIVGRAGRAGHETKGMVIVTDSDDYLFASELIKDSGLENVNGYLYLIITEIEKQLRGHRLIITNDLIALQPEKFKQLIDSVDTSLLNLLGEEIPSDELKSLISNLIVNTYAYTKCNDLQRRFFSELMSVRGDVVHSYIRAGSYSKLKRSGATPRLFEAVQKIARLGDPLWYETVDPLDPKFLNHIHSIVITLPEFIYAFEEYNNRHANNQISFDLLLQIVRMWIEGYWYKDMAIFLDVEVDFLLLIFSSLISYNYNHKVTSIIRIISEIGLSGGQELSDVVSKWPLYLEHGLKNKRELDILNSGFSHRLSIKFIDYYLDFNQLNWSSTEHLRSIIYSHRTQISQYLKQYLPECVHIKAIENINFIGRMNGF